MNFLESIREVFPAIRTNAHKAEEIAMVPHENVELLKQVGFFRSLQPRQFGGLEVEFPEFATSISILAEACASTAWACGLLAIHAFAIALFSRRVQEEIWGSNPGALISSSVAPLGKWIPVDGGIRLSGTFGWSSGCDHADWAVLGYMGKNNVGQPGPCFALVPRSDYVIKDDWDTMALRGTGSKSLVLEDVFVPEHRTESLFGLNFGLSRGYKSHDGDIYHAPFSPIFSIGFSAVALGISRRFAELFTEKTKSRIRAYSGAREIDNAPAQMVLAESTNQIKSARLLLENDWRSMMEHARNKRLPSPDDMLDWRSQQAYAIKILNEAVSRLSMASGGNAWFSSNEMQRLFRDIRITGSHAQTDYTIASQTYGRHLLGLGMDARYY